MDVGTRIRLVVVVAGLSCDAGRPVAAADDSPGNDRQSQQELMASRGLVRHKGLWRTPQEMELLERDHRDDVGRKQWVGRLDRLRGQLDDPATSARAAEEIRGIGDPLALGALVAAVGREPVLRVRILEVEAISHLPGPDALAALATIALDHPDSETRITAVERLAALGPRPVLQPVMAALGGPDNARINRAAEVLGRLEATAAVGPLIAALETEHVVVTGGGREGQTSATFTPAGGGLALGGGPKRGKVRVRNERVLEALVAITGANFEWNIDAWRAWLANHDAPPEFDPRRD
ncbi:MAG: HEAT repeat domain-containing protein [Pirellulales bacterium]